MAFFKRSSKKSTDPTPSHRDALAQSESRVCDAERLQEMRQRLEREEAAARCGAALLAAQHATSDLIRATSELVLRRESDVEVFKTQLEQLQRLVRDVHVSCDYRREHPHESKDLVVSNAFTTLNLAEERLAELIMTTPGWRDALVRGHAERTLSDPSGFTSEATATESWSRIREQALDLEVQKLLEGPQVVFALEVFAEPWYEYAFRVSPVLAVMPLSMAVHHASQGECAILPDGWCERNTEVLVALHHEGGASLEEAVACALLIDA